MFPLHTKIFPKSTSELEKLLNESLRQVLILQNDPVRVVARNYPALEEIVVNLDRASVRPNPPGPRVSVGTSANAFQVARLAIQANPLQVGPAAVNLTLEARDLRLQQNWDAAGEIVLELASATDGSIEVRASKNDLESAIAEVAQRAAEKQGVEVRDLRLTLRQVGPRAVESEVSFGARKMFFTTKVRITGRLSIDDQLNASISNLLCSGDGPIGALACGFLTPQLQKLDGRVFPLMAFSLGETRLRDIRLGIGEELSVAAEFGQ